MIEPTDTTSSTEAGSHREQYEQGLDASAQALTAMSRIRRPELVRDELGRWVEDGDDVGWEHTDSTGCVTLALAGAAENVGGVEALLAGRSRSWEAARRRDLLHSTIGADEFSPHSPR